MKRFLTIAVFLWVAAAISASEEVLMPESPKKVACIGNSVTFGYYRGILTNPSGLPASTFRIDRE